MYTYNEITVVKIDSQCTIKLRSILTRNKNNFVRPVEIFNKISRLTPLHCEMLLAVLNNYSFLFMISRIFVN